MAQKSKLFFASLDGAAAPRAVTGGVCYCCKTALVSTSEAVFAAWRHVYPGNLRDMAFTMSRDGGRTFAAPVRVSEDKWALEGCPDDGPAMAVDAQNRIHIVWPTLVGGATRGRRARTSRCSTRCQRTAGNSRHASGFPPRACRIILESRPARTAR